MGANTLFQSLIRMHGIKYHISEPRQPNQNPSESAIREIKKRWYRIMMKRSVPKRFWDYGIVWVCETGNLSVSSSRHAGGRTPLEIISGETPDISEYVDFGFYDWVSYRSNAGLGENSIGRWLGVSHRVGNLMSYWILTMNCTVISCVTVQRLTRMEQLKDEVQSVMRKFDNIISSKLDAKDIDKTTSIQEQPQWNRLSTDEEDVDFDNDFNRVINDSSVLEADEFAGSRELEAEFTADAYDNYIGMEMGLSRGPDDELVRAMVKR